MKCEKCGKETTRKRFCSRQCYLDRHMYIINGITMKRCPTCKEIKPLSFEYYYRSKSTLNGYHCICKTCDASKHKQWEMNPRYKECRAATYRRNIEWHKQYQRKTQSHRNELEREKKKANPSFALKNRVRVLMYHTLRHVKNGRKWQDLVGYSIDDLRQHIEKQFKDGMNWDLFMDGSIHIDHIIPVSAFNITRPEDIDFKRCWALKNLRPMWAKDNIKKSNKINKPFQPSLAIGMGAIKSLETHGRQPVG